VVFAAKNTTRVSKWSSAFASLSAMFMARLEDAARESRQNISKIQPKLDTAQTSKLLHDLNEYLFDLFDANCLEDFQKLKEFEDRAILTFNPAEEAKDADFDHRHFKLHQEFMTLFEQLIDGFIQQSGYTSEAVFDVIKQHRINSKGNLSEGQDRINAMDIMGVVAFYTDFQSWTIMMKENASYRARFARRDQQHK